MKKNILLPALLLMVAVAFVACDKEGKDATIPLRYGEKVSINDNTTIWFDSISDLRYSADLCARIYVLEPRGASIVLKLKKGTDTLYSSVCRGLCG